MLMEGYPSKLGYPFIKKEGEPLSATRIGLGPSLGPGSESEAPRRPPGSLSRDLGASCQSTVAGGSDGSEVQPHRGTVRGGARGPVSKFRVLLRLSGSGSGGSRRSPARDSGPRPRVGAPRVGPGVRRAFSGGRARAAGPGAPGHCGPPAPGQYSPIKVSQSGAGNSGTVNTDLALVRRRHTVIKLPGKVTRRPQAPSRTAAAPTQ
eukprot:764130-Hanusia_phi.AAC.2